MSLQIWLPLIRDTNNQGLSQATTITNGSNINFTTDGKLGKCVSASANSNNTITITLPGLANMLANGNKYSVACWVKMTSNATANSWVIKLGSNTCGLWWGVSEARWVWNENDNGKRCANPTISSDATNWHHLVTTVDKSVSGSITAKHYVDGLPAASYETQTWDNSSHAQPSGDTITLTPYVSLLNDVRIYDHCLSIKEIKELSKGLVLHYRLSGVSGENLFGNGSDLQTSLDGFSSKLNFSITTEDGIKCAHATGALQTSAYIYSKIPFTPQPNEWVTLSAYVKIKNIVRGTTNPMCEFYFSGQTIDGTWRAVTYKDFRVDGLQVPTSSIGFDRDVSFNINDNKWHYVSATVQWQNYNFTSNIPPAIYLRDCTGDMYVHHIKYERGDKATPWIPNSSDVIYSKLGFDSTLESDCSGYYNDSTKSNIATTSDSARYSTSYVFNGSNSYIKTNGSLWRSDGITELSINLWASMDDWTTFNMRLYSCTEGGGYNVEPSGNNISFSMNAYTDAAKSAYKYITDGGYCAIAKSSLTSGWHMFTYVYTTSGTKLYVDGVLKVNNTYTSYGVHYNATAPLVIGAEATGSGVTSPYFNGKMSDFKLFHTALSAEDIKDLYQVSTSIDNIGNLHAYEVVEL